MAIPFQDFVNISGFTQVYVTGFRAQFTVNSLSVDPNFTFEILLNSNPVITANFTETTPQFEEVIGTTSPPVLVNAYQGDSLELLITSPGSSDVDWTDVDFFVEYFEAQRNVGFGVNAGSDGVISQVELNYTVLQSAPNDNLTLDFWVNGSSIEVFNFLEGGVGPQNHVFTLSSPLNVTNGDTLEFWVQGNDENVRDLAWQDLNASATIANSNVGLAFASGARKDQETPILHGLRFTSPTAGTVKTNTSGVAYIDSTPVVAPKKDDGYALRRVPASISTFSLPTTVPSFTTALGLPTDLRGLAYDGNFLLTLRASDNLLRAVSPSGGAVYTFNLGANYQQILYLGYVTGAFGNAKRYAVVGTGGVKVFDQVSTATDGTPSYSIQGGVGFSTSCAGAFFDGNHLWVVRNSVGTNNLIYLPSILRTSPSGSTSATSNGTITCPNSFLFAPIIVGDRRRYIYILSEGDPTGSMYRYDIETGALTNYLFGFSSDPRCITFDGQYLWVGLKVAIGPIYRVVKIDPDTISTLSLLDAGQPMRENGLQISAGQNVSSIVFDGRRVLVSAHDATNTQVGLCAIDPERFDSLSGLYANTNTFIGSSSGYNQPKGIVAIQDGTGPGTAVYVVSTLGIHKAFDPVNTDLGNVNIQGGQVVHMRTETGSILLSPQDYLIRCNHSAPVSISLPTTAKAGQTYVIKDVSSAGAATNNITISQSGGTIDGAVNYVIATNAGAVGLVYAGSNVWNVF